MKKLFVVLAIFAAFSISALAQPRGVGIGGNFASPFEISYQHYLGEKLFLEGNVGFMFPFYHFAHNYIVDDGDFLSPDKATKFGVMVTTTANFILARPSWTSYGSWEIYAGSGLSLGYVPDAGSKYAHDYIHRFGNGFMMSLPLNAGLSFKFPFHLCLSAVMRPQIGFHMSKCVFDNSVIHCGFYDYGLFGFIPSLAVHYAF